MDLTTLAQSLVRPLGAWFLRNDTFYATGTWTPAMFGGTAAGTTTHAANGQIGHYTRKGREVTASAVVEWTAANGTGNMRFSLPFPSVAGTRRYYAASLFTDSITIGTNYTPYGIVFAGVDYLELYTPANNAASTAIAVEAAGLVVYTVVYFI